MRARCLVLPDYYDPRQSASMPLAPTRAPSRSELEWFRLSPDVGGYAASDGHVVVNPFNRLTPSENEALIRNESARIFMRDNPSAQPTAQSFGLTPSQASYPYAASPPPMEPSTALRRSMAARVLTGDPSAGQPTAQQGRFSEELLARMMAARQAAAKR